MHAQCIFASKEYLGEEVEEIKRWSGLVKQKVAPKQKRLITEINGKCRYMSRADESKTKYISDIQISEISEISEDLLYKSKGLRITSSDI